ncbi:hypothetical protein V5O48_007169 [Marasmius crinis-equi]|uniref:Uncharacterized protein n=1 Tax=Marasmius crinis-equi TaxID=585013 RepID=A0ABR3FHY3_9AGAR
MVLTRSQAARARTQQLGQLDQPTAGRTTGNRATATPRSSPRKRTSASTPKPKARATAERKSNAKKGKGRAEAKGKAPECAPSEPVVSTPERPFGRGWPQTPRAPRKSGGPSLKPDFPAHLSPHPSIEGAPLLISVEDINDGKSSPVQHRRFDVENLTFVTVPSDDGTSTNASTVVLSDPVDTVRRQRPSQFLSPRDIAAGIPGMWTRSPGESSRRLVVVPEERGAQEERLRGLGNQVQYNRIFQEQYDRMLLGREACMQRHEEFMRANELPMSEDVMEV